MGPTGKVGRLGPASEGPQVLLLGFGLQLASRSSRGCPKINRHLPFSWIKQYIVSDVIFLARGSSSELQVGWLPCQPLALLPCSGCRLSLHLMGGLPGRGMAESLDVPALFSLTGMQPVLLQEGLPPLCSGKYQCFPSGNPAGCGEEKGCQQEALQPSLTGRGTASCEALGWARPGFQLGAVYLVFSELCGVRAASGTEELAKTEDRQQECSQLELQTWPLVEARSEGEGPPFDSW